MTVSATIFLVAAMVHLLRIITGFQMVLGNWAAPIWISIIGVLVAGFLSWTGFKNR